jgi:hypothetical protein
MNKAQKMHGVIIERGVTCSIFALMCAVSSGNAPAFGNAVRVASSSSTKKEP